MREIIYNNAGKLSASMICSGWDPYKGYQIYSVNQTGYFKESDWAMSGSGSTFIWGYFDANYKQDMELVEAMEAEAKKTEPKHVIFASYATALASLVTSVAPHIPPLLDWISRLKK